MTNPNLPCCHSCGTPGAPESFVLYRMELVCATCHEDHEAKRYAEGCSECGANKGAELTEIANGDLLCPSCLSDDNEARAERAEHAANEGYYGGECDRAVYERNSR